MSGAKRILPLLAVLCFALFLLYGVYFNAFGANAESMMAFFGITESRQGFVMTIQSLGGIVMTVLLGLFGERLHKLYGLLAGAVLVGVAGVTIGTMPLYGNDSYGLLLVFALVLAVWSVCAVAADAQKADEAADETTAAKPAGQGLPDLPEKTTDL